MSRSNPQLTNPATRFFEWAGGKGELNFYDKEKEKRIVVPLPFEFLPLDQLSTIVGYSKRDESGYWANEVRNVTNDKFIVRTKHGIAQEGLYADLATVRAKGAKYAKSVYMAYKTKDGWQIGNIKMAGSALSAWIEFSNKCVPENGKVVMTRGEAQDAPTGQFFAPVLKYESCTPEENNIAMGLDRDLQIFLKTYIATNTIEGDPSVNNAYDPDEGKATPEEIEDFERRKREMAKDSEDDQAVDDYKRLATEEKDVVVEDIEGEPINLDDIPF